jgi:hypothetical protein
VAFYGELMGASGRQVFPEGVFVLAATLRWLAVAVLCGLVIREILRPDLDAVRRTYPDDPDGGLLDGVASPPLLPRPATVRRRPPVPVGSAS